MNNELTQKNDIVREIYTSYYGRELHEVSV